MTEMIIKKGSMNLTMDRNDLIEVVETPDGVSFSFKNGFQLQYIDPYMDNARKQIIKNSSDSYEGKKLVFDFDNQRHPVMVHAE
jgi:hypothetical protein